MTPQSAAAGPVLTFLKIAAGLLGVLCAAQLVLGMLTLGDEGAYKGLHGMSGNVTALVAVIAAVAAVLWRRQSGNTGLMAHALATAVLAIVQIGLGEAELRTLHITLGLLVVVAGIALATLTFRKPGTRITG